MTAERSVRLKDIAPRLTFQAYQAPTEHKVELIDRLTAAGLPAIEATSFVRPDLVPGLADAAEVMARVRRPAGVRFECCIGNERGLRDAIEAGMDGAWFLLSADDDFARNNIGRTPEDSLELLAHLREVAEGSGTTVGTYVIFAWGGPSEPARGAETFAPIGRRLREIGVDDWILADSAGYAAPKQMRNLVEGAVELNDLGRLTVQVHDARGMGLANVVELINLGVRNIDVSLGGSGGHPAMPDTPGGGICTEDVVQMLDLLGVDSGVDLDAVIAASNWLADEVGAPTLGFVRKIGSVPSHQPSDEVSAFNWSVRS
ncbi:pyruvate carboxyltransferase [Aeromicrobium tamlense]|uniref:Hydroxymethylglutaryl-CoA lyase n=1 Tax=Aeromicrobium tamlense TaxID=375541 RepID=A0A8I0FXG0_9ACTN|nr:pyruvate carboxyltransferase [Aeromicrobium tamlense]MBD1270745.1 pyruvate carboxyltransferase [Aeromicrobium tamlense]MBD1271123.1 pyruvate carboxyltransferase [Aeromicrobium tamlense]NYI38137.1 hydroxymethylglutaryl-CoA lyase [Aeromicrobium tamlense]